MKGAYHFYPCPHCGERMRSGSIATHEPVCFKNPTVYERIRGVLSSDGKHGITRGRYLELSTGDKSLPSLNTLVRRIAPCWDNILAFFKLSPPLPDACRSQCPKCGEFIAGGKLAAHQEQCQQNRAAKVRKPKPAPAPVEPPAIACTVAAPEAHAVSLPLPRITPRPAARTANKWVGTKGYDPTWQAPTGDTQWLVVVQPGERTCLECGDTFAAGGYCIRCGVRDDGAWCSEEDRPPSVLTVDYLRPDEYMVIR